MECHEIPWNVIDVVLFPWHFSGIMCHPGGMPWNTMDVILFPWHFSGILWHPGGMPWNAMNDGRYIIFMAFQ